MDYHDNNSHYAAHKENGQKIYLGIIFILTAAIWLLNRTLPPEWMSKFFYIIPVLFAVGLRKGAHAFWVSGTCTLLIVIDFLVRKPGRPVFEVALVNTLLIVLLLQITALMIFLYRRAGQLTRSLVQQKRIIVELGRLAVSGEDFDRLLEWTHKALTEHFESKYSKILRYLPEDDRMMIISGQGWDKEITSGWSESTKDDTTYSGYTLHQNRPVIVRNLNKEKRFVPPDLLLKHGIKSCINVLIPHKDHAYGILEVDTTDIARFRKEDIYFMQAIARLLGDAVDRLELLAHLREKAELLERSNIRLEEFAGIVAHDIKGPAVQVNTLMEVMEHAKDAEEAEEYKGLIRATSLRLIRLVDLLLKYAKSQTGIQFEPVDLNEVVKSACQMIEIPFKKTKAVIEVDSLPVVKGDRDLLEQVFTNILSNALKYRKKDQPPKIAVKSRDLGAERVEISVKDQGTGIKPEWLSDMFKPFKRFSSGDEPGTGLGLAICKNIVEHHGGQIRAESQYGEYAVILITLNKQEIGK